MDELVERLAKLDTSVVSDVLDELGLPNQCLSSEFHPLNEDVKLAGRALCAYGRSILRGAPLNRGASPYELERKIKAGDVVVIDAGAEYIGAVVGGFVAATLKARGCTGIIVNGAIRDSAEIRAMGLATFSRATSPVNASRRWEIAGTATAISLPGATGAQVTISPGDLLLGDADGILVVPTRWGAEIITASEELMRIEDRIRGEVLAGATREEAFARHPRFSHIKRLVD